MHGEGYNYATCRETAEIEAESVAHIVTAALGMDTSDYTAPYIAGWAGGDITKVKETATRVVNVAHRILNQIDGQREAEEEEEA